MSSRYPSRCSENHSLHKFPRIASFWTYLQLFTKAFRAGISSEPLRQDLVSHAPHYRPNMNAGTAHTHESQFGPPSELIHVSKFIQQAVDLHSRSPVPCDAFHTSAESVPGRNVWFQLSEEQRNVIVTECSVSEIQSSLLEVWSNPRLVAHLSKSHGDFVNSIHDAADTSSKRRRKRVTSIDPTKEHPEVTELQKKLDSVQLKSWPLTFNSALLMRPPKNSDQNAFSEVKASSNSGSLLSACTREALLTISVHNRLSWNQNYLSRASQHMVLASQTLSDLFEAIPCTSNEQPDEILDDDHIIGYKDSETPNSSGCVICIEGVVYGDGQSDDDYADKLIELVGNMPAVRRPSITKGDMSMHETSFSSLSLRLNQPYWLLHQGNCEHFLVVDEIRLQHPSDPPSGYPLTLQVTPPLLNLCRACTKVPAVWSVVGDMRLGESPCVLCAPCWRHMGNPDQGEDVVVVPLPKHELGW